MVKKIVPFRILLLISSFLFFKAFKLCSQVQCDSQFNTPDSLFKVKNYKNAVAEYEKIWETVITKDCDSLKLHCLNRIAYCHYNQRNFEKAGKIVEQRLPIFEQQFLQRFPIDVARSYSLIAASSKWIEDFSKALKFYEKAIDVYNQMNLNDRAVAYAYRNAAQIILRSLNYEKAVKYLELALKADSTNFYQSSIYSLLAMTYNYLEESEKVLKYYNLGMKSGNLPSLRFGNLNSAAANAYARLGESEKAKITGQKVLKAIENRSGGNYSQLRMRTNLFLANLESEEGNFEFAEKFIDVAITEIPFYSEKKTRESARTYVEAGKFYFKNKKLIKSLECFQQAIIQTFPKFNSQNISDNPSTEDVYPESWIMTACARKGEALKYRYDQNGDISDLENAAECFDLSIAGIEKLKQTYGSDAAKIYMSAYSFNYYEEAIEVNYLLFKEKDDERYLNKIFEIAEKSKATALIDAIQKNKAIIYADLPDSLLQKEEDLRLAIGDYEKILKQDGQDSLTFANIKSQLSDSRLEYERLIENLKKINPKFKALSESESVPTIADIRENLLADADFVIEFFEGEKAIYYLQIGKNAIEIEKIDKTESLQSEINNFLHAFRNPEIISNDFPNFLKTGNRLFFNLFPNLMSSNRFENQKIIIIPDGILNYIPFDALVINSDSNQPEYFLNHTGIQIGYSATVLLAQRDLPVKNNSFLHFAPEDFLNRESKMARLKYGKEEVAVIKKILSFSGKAASLNNFKNQSSDKGIIHLSTHADGSRDTPLIEFYDSTFYLPELYALNLSADLVVLSACETGLGKMERGEGVMSLARGFTYAGAKSLIASLWSVNERSTATIMSDFYGHLKDGKTKSEALRAAKLDYLAKATSEAKKSPYYWAGFIFIGTDGTVDLNSGMSPVMWIFFGVMALGILWLIFNRFRSS